MASDRPSSLSSIATSAAKTLINTLLISAIALGSLSVAYQWIRPKELEGEALAIALGKRAFHTSTDRMSDITTKIFRISDADTPDTFVQNEMNKTRGELNVEGWSARSVGDGVYLVSFVWSQGESKAGYYLEVNTKNRFTRAVVPDDVLALKYNVRTREKYDAEERQTAAAIKAGLGAEFKLKDDQFRYADHVLRIEGNPQGDYEPRTLAQYVRNKLQAAFKHREDRYFKVIFQRGDDIGTCDGETE